jgi:hypothetical protein
MMALMVILFALIPNKPLVDAEEPPAEVVNEKKDEKTTA